jgi:hypothetical protein
VKTPDAPQHPIVVLDPRIARTESMATLLDGETEVWPSGEQCSRNSELACDADADADASEAGTSAMKMMPKTSEVYVKLNAGRGTAPSALALPVIRLDLPRVGVTISRPSAGLLCYEIPSISKVQRTRGKQVFRPWSTRVSPLVALHSKRTLRLRVAPNFPDGTLCNRFCLASATAYRPLPARRLPVYHHLYWLETERQEPMPLARKL